MVETKPNIVIIGAGVTGLTTALLLSQRPKYNIIIAAKHMPGDYDAEYTSPWAGAHFSPGSPAGTTGARWETNTWPELERLARNVPEAGIHFQENFLFARDKDSGAFANVWSSPEWLASVAPNYRKLSGPAELRDGAYDSGCAFTSVCVNTMVYLPWLVGRCRAAGVALQREVFAHVADAAALVPPEASGGPAVVVNCTGLGARKLGGVADTAMTPARGQVVVVRNSLGGLMASNGGTDDGPDEVTYAMERAAGGGTILGGCYQKGNWDPLPDMNMATRIMRRAVELCPQLTGGKGIEHLDVIRHAVGLRPVREGGTRVEREVVEKDGRKLSVVHSYGHGGYGYQSSYGCAQDVVKLVEEAVAEGSKTS